MDDRLGVEIREADCDLHADRDLLAYGELDAIFLVVKQTFVKAAAVTHFKDHAEGWVPRRGRRKINRCPPVPDNIRMPNLDQDPELKKKLAHFGLDIALPVLGLADLFYRHLCSVLVTAVYFSERPTVDLNGPNQPTFRNVLS